LRGEYEPPLNSTARGTFNPRARSPIQSDDPAGRPSARTVLVRSDFMIGFRIGCHTVYDALLGIVITASHAMAVPPKTLVFMRFGVRFCGQNFQY
jgi:hypothetical protein